MKFSIVMATMGAATLSEALDSILQSTYDNWELVLVIDNPEFELDEEKIFKGFDLDKVVIIRNKENVGLTRSLNIAIDKCTGDVISRLDDDDKFTSNRLYDVFSIFKNHENFSVVTGGGVIVHDDGQKYEYSVPAGHLNIVSGLEKKNILIHSALHVETKLMKKIGGYNESFRYAQDYELYLRLIRQGAIFASLPNLVERRECSGSITITKRRNQALFSFSALSLHHAILWDGNSDRMIPLIASFLRFLIPQFIRRLFRYMKPTIIRGFYGK